MAREQAMAREPGQFACEYIPLLYRSAEMIFSDHLNKSMLSAYDDIKTRPCDACLKVIDDDFQFPTIRIERKLDPQVKVADSTWEAYHRNCRGRDQNKS